MLRGRQDATVTVLVITFLGRLQGRGRRPGISTAGTRRVPYRVSDTEYSEYLYSRYEVLRLCHPCHEMTTYRPPHAAEELRCDIGKATVKVIMLTTFH